MAIQYAIAIGTTVTMQPPPWIATSAPPPRNDDRVFAVIARAEGAWRSRAPLPLATIVTMQAPYWIATALPRLAMTAWIAASASPPRNDGLILLLARLPWPEL